MKIVHITDVHPRHDARILKRQAVSLSEAGHDVILVTGDGLKDEDYKGVRITSYSDHAMTKRERLKLMFFKRDFLKFLLSFDADVYQFHDFEIIEVGKALKKKGKHVIFDSHENWLDIIPDQYFKTYIGRELFKILLPFYYRRVVSRFDAVFSVSPNMVEKLKHYNPNSYMVSNFPSVKGFSANSASEKSNYFVYQGVVYKSSNQEECVKAISNMEEDVRYRIIGKITDEMREKVKSLDVNNRVEILDWIEKAELDSIMDKSICGFVILNYVPTCCGKEGQLGSNKIFEYMLCGLPVICTDFVLWKKLIIDKYKCGICVEPGNVEQIQAAMEWVVRHPLEAKAMGERGREAVLRVFNWENELPAYLSYYQTIVSK